MKLKWKKVSGLSAHYLYLGNELVGVVVRNYHFSKRGGFRARSTLIEQYNDDCKTLKEGKEWVEKLVKEWVASAGLTGGESEQK